MKPEVLESIIGLLVFAIIVYGALLGKSEAVRMNKLRNLLYIILSGLCIGILGFIRLMGLKGNPVALFIILMVTGLILGILHVRFYQRLLGWPSKGSFLAEFLVTLNTAVMGAVFLLLAFQVSGMTHFGPMLATSVVCFMVPLPFVKSVEWYFLIPERIFKTWAYPLDNPIPDPTDQELAMPMVISFEFQKKVDDGSITIFRAKAPKDIQFGKLFYFFINDYNSRHPESTIEFASRTSAFPWVFHFKPRFLVKTRFLDPDETVYHNQIRENSVIVCKRIIDNQI